MAAYQLPARPLIAAGGCVFAIVVAPALIASVGPTAYHAPRVVAQQGDQCSNGETMDAYNLQCVPIVAPGGGTTSSGNFFAPGAVGGGGAPSENQLTQTNPGVGSPSHR